MTDSDATPNSDDTDASETVGVNIPKGGTIDLKELAAKFRAIGERRDPNNEENAKFYEELGASVAAQKRVLSGYVQRSR